MKRSKEFSPFVSSLVAIACGLIVGYIILLIANPTKSFSGLQILLAGPINEGKMGIVLHSASSLILCGLSVGFAFKTGLFNIGASGQFLVGAFGGILVGITCKFLGPCQWVVALLAAMLFGAIWGALSGILKAYFNVNEVISCIILNYISRYLVNLIVNSNEILLNPLRRTNPVADTANLPRAGMEILFPKDYVNIGIILAIVIAITIFIVLEKTTFGYELKACGLNKMASRYAGINENRSIVCSMLVAGAIAGLAGGIMFLSGTGRYIEMNNVIPNEGFDGISVALLGVSNPIGIIFSGLFIAYLNQGGSSLESLNYSQQIIAIIIAVIVYFSAFALIIKKIMLKFKKKNKVVVANDDKKNER